MLGKEVPMLATITEPINRYGKCHRTVWTHHLLLVHIENVHMFVFTRSKSVWSLKPVPGRRRPQPHLGTRWNSQKPTWSFEVNFFLQLWVKCNAEWKLWRKHSVYEIFYMCVYPGMINSRCIIGGVLEKRLTPLPATLIMGAFVNHRGDKLQVGLGINVG